MARTINAKPSYKELQIQKYLTKDILKKLYNEGYSANYIATKFFAPDFITNKTTVLKYLYKYGIKKENNSIYEKSLKIKKYLTKKNLEKLFNKGYTVAYIASKCFAPEFITTSSTIIRYAKKYNINTNDKTKRKKRLDPNIQKYLTKEILIKLYKEGYSANYIAKKYFAPDFETNAGTVIQYAKLYGIKTRSVKEANALEKVQAQKKKTNLEKYGVENVSQIKEVKQKKINKSLEVYGVKNVFQDEGIKLQSRKTNLIKYGTEYPGSLNRISGHHSKFQKELEKLLKKNNIIFESEVSNKFKSYNEFYKKEYSPRVDILIEKHKLVIECNGDIWHANPFVYKEDDIIELYSGPTEARCIWARDYYREIQIESFGYDVYIVWESDFKKDKEYIIEDIKNFINKKSKKQRR